MPLLVQPNTIESQFRNRGFASFGHISMEELSKRKLIKEDYLKSAFKFSFVRNPYDRAISLFHYLKKQPFKSCSIPLGMSFLHFSRMLVNSKIPDIGFYNVHGMSQCNPQITWLRNVEINFIGKYEHLEQDLQAIFNSLNLRKIKHPLARLNRSDASKNRLLFTKESKENIEYYYRSDFLQLGYSLVSDQKMLSKRL